MKKSRIFLAAGTAVLAISAVFATKASKKFSAGFSTVVAFGGDFKYVATSDLFTTVGHNTGNTVQYPLAYGAIYTLGGKNVIAQQLVTAVNKTEAVHWKN